MSFNGKVVKSDNNNITITNLDDFFPDLSLNRFISIYRLPLDYDHSLLINHVQLAMVFVNDQLSLWRLKKHSSLDQAYILLYERAVFAYAKSTLLKQSATMERRDNALSQAKNSIDLEDEFLKQVQIAIAQIQNIHFVGMYGL